MEPSVAALQEARWSSLDATVPYDDDSEMVAHLLGIYSSSSEQDCHDQIFAAAGSYHCSLDNADTSFDVLQYGGIFFGSHCGYDSYEVSDVINVGSTTSMNNNCDSISPLGGPTRLNDGETSSDEIAELGGAQDQVLQPKRKSGSSMRRRRRNGSCDGEEESNTTTNRRLSSCSCGWEDDSRASQDLSAGKGADQEPSTNPQSQYARFNPCKSLERTMNTVMVGVSNERMLKQHVSSWPLCRVPTKATLKKVLAVIGQC
ncbi:hypothetical protein GW17_00034289 [Ensete ventricosum]|nr:hypothetical protein GW17_00034289 [Ensete ventricosum]